jgi:uncharacterized protein YcfJ
MKTIFKTIILSLSLLTFINPLYAGHYRHEGNAYEDNARVIKVKPIYESIETVIPKESCWEEKVVTRERQSPSRNYGGIVVGGILGGVAGHQVGRGRGKDVATVAGSLLGALFGDNVANSGHRSSYHRQVHYETHCDTIETITTREEIVAYDVKYRYKGNTYWTRTKYHPGKYIAVKVKVKPLHLARR